MKLSAAFHKYGNETKERSRKTLSPRFSYSGGIPAARRSYWGAPRFSYGGGTPGSVFVREWGAPLLRRLRRTLLLRAPSVLSTR